MTWRTGRHAGTRHPERHPGRQCGRPSWGRRPRCVPRPAAGGRAASSKTDVFMKDSYRIDVKDFGPIARASVDFRPLTVFVGPSNTGKSYLAVLLYALHQCLGGSDAFYPRAGIRTRFPPAFNLSIDELIELTKSLKDWTENVSYDGSPPALPRDVAEAIRSVLEKTDRLGDSLTNEIRRCFGVDNLELLIRRSSSRRGKVRLCVSQESGSSTLHYEFNLNSRGIQVSANVPPLEALPSKIDLPKRLLEYLRRNVPAAGDDPDVTALPTVPDFTTVPRNL